MKPSILLVKTPFFSPWTPPLGIAILKSHLERHGYPVTCYDFNVDPELWGTHHKYFKTLQELEGISVNDGYSKLWWILNAHMLAYANGASRDECADVLDRVIPLYGLKHDRKTVAALLPVVERFYERLGELLEEIDLPRYSVVGTSTYSTSLGSSLFFLRRVKELHPEVKTVMGGGIFADDLALGSDNLQTLVEEYPYVDHMVLGEGEVLFHKLVEGELAHKRVITISDVNAGGLDMKDVPSPDFSDFDLGSYYHLTIEGARSCPFQCSFCSETIQWGKYRKKPMGDFAEQVVGLAERFGNKSFFMGDSLMNPYIAEFSQELLSRGAPVAYDGYLRADKPVTHRGRVKQWARSGLYRVRLGIESASARVLDMMDKMTTPGVISDVFKSLASAGVRPTTYWIVGFPGETEEDFRETLDFIRENHRYIYELEAHPYYYYPYGQIGSRLYKCESLYPEEVTRVIKFKVWDIVDGSPTREERYDRLRRISQLASELGLPNIYTMAERYAAEDRWHSMYPLATEIFEGTRPSRTACALPARPFAALAPAEEESGAVVCYRARVSGGLDEAVLAASAEQLIRHCEMLQVGLRGGTYFPAEGEGWLATHALLSTFDARDAAADEPDDDEILRAVAPSMRAEAGASVRLALVRREGGDDDLYLLAHRGVADARSAALLYEDLFRIYEQLSHGVPVSLRPVTKTYAEFARETSPAEDARPRPQAVAAEDDAAGFGQIGVELGERLRERLLAPTLADYDVKPAELLATALLRAAVRADEWASPEVSVAYDYRLADARLGRAVGALTHTRRLRAGDSDGDDLMLDVQRVQQAMRAPADFEHDGGADGRVLFDLEYFVETPWLGGDSWTPCGFALTPRPPRTNFDVEVTPALAGLGVEVTITHRDTPPLAGFAARLGAVLREEVESVLDALTGEGTAAAETISVEELDQSFTF